MCFTELPGNIVPAEPAVGARVFIHKAGYPASLNEHMLVISTGYYGSVLVSWCAKNWHILTAPWHLLTAPEDL